MIGLFPKRETLIRNLTRLWLILRHQVFSRRHRRLTLEELDGVPLLVLPEVFNPVLFRTGAFLAQTIPLSLKGRGARGEGPEKSALDLGAGSGIGAIFAARLGYRVVGVDINPEAVRCARLNALLNRLEDRVEIRSGDLFAPVTGEQFDLVLFNPPFFRGEPRDGFEQAWRAPDVLERFAAGLRPALKPGGRALIVLSTDGDAPGMLKALDANGFAARPVAQRDLGSETLTVYSVGDSS